MIGRASAWLTDTKHSLYGVSVTRMIVGFVVATQVLVNAPDRSYTWGDGSEWTSSVPGAERYPVFFGLFGSLDGWWFDLAYLATMLSGVVMMLGYRARLATFVTLVLWVSLSVTNPFVVSGGDAVLRMVLFYLLFTESGRYWSVDSWLRRRGREVRPLTPPWFSAALHNLAVILLIHQVVMVYVGSALWKVQSPVWRDGTAVYYPLQTDAYSPWVDVLHPVYASGPVIAGATYTAMVVQLLFPLLLTYRPTRLAALVLITGMHLAIGLLMGILYFSLAMISVDMMLVSDTSWRRFAAWARGRTSRVRAGSAPQP